MTNSIKKSHLNDIRRKFMISINPQSGKKEGQFRKSTRKVQKDNAFDAEKQIKKFIKKK